MGRVIGWLLCLHDWAGLIRMGSLRVRMRIRGGRLLILLVFHTGRRETRDARGAARPGLKAGGRDLSRVHGEQ